MYRFTGKRTAYFQYLTLAILVMAHLILTQVIIAEGSDLTQDHTIETSSTNCTYTTYINLLQKLFYGTRQEELCYDDDNEGSLFTNKVSYWPIGIGLILFLLAVSMIPLTIHLMHRKKIRNLLNVSNYNTSTSINSVAPDNEVIYIEELPALSCLQIQNECQLERNCANEKAKSKPHDGHENK